jgi:transglutaminase-like putative cysteine protease
VIYRIRHLTRYVYSRPVFVEPLQVRLRPRCGPGVRLLDFDLRLAPAPAGTSWIKDAAGNDVLSVWFDGLTPSLEIMIRATVQTSAVNPFDYMPGAEANAPPLVLSENDRELLAPCLLQRHPAPPGGDELDRVLAALPGGKTSVQACVLSLNQWIFENIAKTVRTEPGVLTPQDSLRRGRGACRDLAVLFMEGVRRMGVPARFVSGYQEGDPDKKERDLHAWAEAYFPGGGWRGFDPTHGLAAADRHIPLAHGPAPSDAAPLTGAFRGTNAASRLEHSIKIAASKENPTKP